MKHSVLAFVILCLLAGCATPRTNVPASGGKTETLAPNNPEQNIVPTRFPLCNEEHPENTVGLRLCDDAVYPAYTLFAPNTVPNAYLIDQFGQLRHKWDLTTRPGSAVYLLNNGLLLATGKHDTGSELDIKAPSVGGMIQMLDWDSKVVWDFRYADNNHLAHHDIQMMPNGNILIIAWESKSRDEVIATGRNPGLLTEKGLFMPDHIVEVKPTQTGGDIVWSWHVWDHLIQNFDSTKPNYGDLREHPELVNINARFPKTASWNHINSIDYNEKLDQILLSVNSFSEIWVIDHSTTTAEAASHSGGRWGKGGDLLYRWGNPLAYGAGTVEDQMFFYQHNAQWIRDGLPGAGNFLVFNNGKLRKGSLYSTVDELKPEFDSSGAYLLRNKRFLPDGLVWSYKAKNPEDFFSGRISSAQRLANGNTFICSGNEGILFEITPNGEKVWEYVNPVDTVGIRSQGEHSDYVDKQKDNTKRNAVFKAIRIEIDHPGLKGRDITPKGFIERPAGVKSIVLPK